MRLRHGRELGRLVVATPFPFARLEGGLERCATVGLDAWDWRALEFGCNNICKLLKWFFWRLGVVKPMRDDTSVSLCGLHPLLQSVNTSPKIVASGNIIVLEPIGEKRTIRSS